MNPIKVPLFFTSVITFCISITSSVNSDGLSLLALKAAVTADPTNALTTWRDTDLTPCHWTGVACNSNHRVISIFLPNRNLTGYLPSELGALLSLRHISLTNNNFSKLIPDHLFNATNLLSINLSHNSLTGPIPEKITSLKFLKFLDLSSNSLNGSLPESLSDLTNLAGTLNLSYNQFSGEIPASYGLFQVRVSLDLSHNNLTGKIPLAGSLLNRVPISFTGNPFLCGFPLETQCSDPEAQNPRVLTNPDTPKYMGSLAGSSGNTNSSSGSVSVPLISGVSVVIGVIFFSMWVYRRKRRSSEGKFGQKEIEKEHITVITKEVEGQNGKFVVMDEGFGLELEDLLRASAYVVGKSTSGIVYKVVAGGVSGSAAGVVVAVRRLNEGDSVWRVKEFEAEVETIGRVQHPNIVRLRAYYYANDEKLLVSDFIDNGSLYSALHGGPTNPLPPLSWASRLKIAQGIARGLAHIHEYSPRKQVHGNIKSSKILLDDDLQPFLSGFGLNRLGSTTISKSTSQKHRNSSQPILTGSKRSLFSSPNVHYMAPEARMAAAYKLSPKCDIYSFGIVLLEMLTGQAPDNGGLDSDGKGLESFVRKVFREERPLTEIIDPVLLQEVHAKKQVVRAFHIALNCTELDPEVRPKMRLVSDCLDRIKLQ